MRERLHRPIRQEEPAIRSENDNAMQENDLISRFPNGIFGNNDVDTPKQQEELAETSDTKTANAPQQKKEVEKQIKPRDKYEEAILKDKIVYTKNYGWIDKTHAFPIDKKTPTGAKKLWNTIEKELGIKSNSPGDNNGFRVAYRQDAKVASFLPRIGVTKEYFVKYNLTTKQKESVALSIFQEVSKEFEEFQGWAFWSGSSFEPADLPSNMLSFYSAIRPRLTEEKIMLLVEPLTKEQSIEVYREYPGTFTDSKHKNKTFTPKFFPNKYSPKNPVVPKELQEVIPATKGTNFRDWLPLLDIHGGVPPITGPKY